MVGKGHPLTATSADALRGRFRPCLASVRLGFLLRAFIGRRPDDHILRRVVRRFRNTRLARMVFGLVHGDALDPDETRPDDPDAIGHRGLRVVPDRALSAGLRNHH